MIGDREVETAKQRYQRMARRCVLDHNGVSMEWNASSSGVPINA